MIALSDPTGAGVVSRSFRDPDGRVLRSAGRILRAVKPDSATQLEAFLATRAAREALDHGKLVRSARIPFEKTAELQLVAGEVLFEHERIPFASYPHEWTPEMLASAGALTLELFQSALQEGFGLKDATPYNVLFRGTQPVFVDVLSFERREALDATWIAYAQFVRTFLLPLVAHRHFGLAPADVFQGQRDGLAPAALYQWAGFWKRLTPSFLSLVTLPRLLAGRATAKSYRSKPAPSPEQARFILDHLVHSCERQLKKVAPRARESAWSGYLDHKSLYSPAQLEAKEQFIREALEMAGPRTVLDIGANEGRFSLLAAQKGASVVAIDSDPAVVGTIWRKARGQNLDVLPLVVDITRPTPAIGWRNQECDSFLDRARGRFDMVMMLAVLHHMLVTERVPLDEILKLTSELTRNYVLIEFVAPEDPMFQRIARGRETLYGNLTFEAFEAAAAAHFDLIKLLKIEGLHRCLYLFRSRNTRA